jgi:hypothetical protein
LLKRCISLVVCTLSAAVLCWPVTASAEDAKPVEQVPEPPPLIARPDADAVHETGGAEPPASFLIEFGDTNDWIQFKAGEWLKGELKRLHQKDVEFKSKKLKLMTFKWKDIVQLQARKIKTYVFEGKNTETGKAMITKEEVIIYTADGVKIYPREQLISIIRGEPRERNYWSARLRAGLSGAAGNSRNLSLNTFFRLMREDELVMSVVSYEGTFGHAAGEQTVNRQLGIAEVNIYITRRFYLIPLVAELLNDRFQNIRLRASPSAGAGVYLFDEKKVEWNLSGGLGDQYLKLLSTEEGTEDPQHDGGIAIGSFFKWKFIPDNNLQLEWRTNLIYTQIGLTNHIGTARLKIKIASILRLTTEFMFLRTESPLPRADGTEPKSNDYQLVVGLEVKINE